MKEKRKKKTGRHGEEDSIIYSNAAMLLAACRLIGSVDNVVK